MERFARLKRAGKGAAQRGPQRCRSFKLEKKTKGV
jgi:hypothetical protein